MTPRVMTKAPPFGRGSLRFVAAALALLTGSVMPRESSATPTSIVTRPEAPTVCDSVGLIVTGSVPNPCYHVISSWVERIEQLPTMGPIPAYAIRVGIWVIEPNPLVDHDCPAVLQPYERVYRLGRLPVGRYFVTAREYLAPFSPDTSAAARDTSSLDAAFDVRPATCPPGVGCTLLSFGPSDSSHAGHCDGTARPGGTACFDVVLMNEVPVGGVQTEIVVNNSRYEPYGPTEPILFRPTSVEVAGRAAGFQVAWTNAEASRLGIVLYSATGATIAAGQGSILHVCYSVAPEAPEGRYPIIYDSQIIADPAGGEIPRCLTFASIVGSICVAKTGCDLNGDGASDIVDIVQLVHCVLTENGGDACPDSVATKADCNGDGVLDVRDVICCVRKILEGGGLGLGGGAPADTSGATGIGFTGPAQWISPTEGRATIEVTPGAGFAGIQFGINAHSSPARIREVRLLEPAGAYQLESSVYPGGGIALAMLFPSTVGIAASGPIRLEVTLVPALGSSGNKGMALFSAKSANLAAQAMATKATAPTAEVPQSPAAAPSLSVPAPNPFAVGTEVAYTVPTQRRVTLRVYSVSGRLVRTLVDASVPAGVHRAQWDGRDSAGHETRSGIYFFKYTAGDVERTARVMRLR